MSISRRICRLSLVLPIAALFGLAAPGPGFATAVIRPDPPRVHVDTTFAPPSGRTIAVPAGGNFQAALDAARPGSVITLQAGATYEGPFTLPNKTGSGWIYIESSALARLPGPGARVAPSDAPHMPRLVAGSRAVITAAPGAHHYRFVGIEITPRDGVFLYNLVVLGYGEMAVDQVSHHIIFDRCYLHGDPNKGTRRGIAMNSADTAVIDSYLSDFKEVGADNQAIMGWNGSGPFRITNDYLEAAGENVMFGGADASIPGLVPSDIEVRGNHFAKPLSWRVGDPAYAGTPWTVKNLFELKNAQRVLVDGNVFEDNWVGADQHGAAILFTVRNQDGAAPWSTVSDVTFTHNIVRLATEGISFLGRDYPHPSGQTRRILVQNNLFVDIGAFPQGDDHDGRLFQLVDDTADVIIDHNTALQTGIPLVAAIGIPGRAAHHGFVFTNNITPANRYGVSGDYTFGNALMTLRTYFPDSLFARNVLPGGHPSTYPPDNFFPPSLEAVGFINAAGGDYRLAPSIPYKNAGTDGKDIGADIDAITAATEAAIPGHRISRSRVRTSQ